MQLENLFSLLYGELKNTKCWSILWNIVISSIYSSILFMLLGDSYILAICLKHPSIILIIYRYSTRVKRNCHSGKWIQRLARISKNSSFLSIPDKILNASQVKYVRYWKKSWFRDCWEYLNPTFHHDNFMLPSLFIHSLFLFNSE